MMWAVVILAGIVGGLFVVVALQPGDFKIARGATIKAAPADVFPHINNFHNWDAWSPWAKLDPDMKTTFEGPEAGTGAKYSWNGNNKVGAGKMAILESREPRLIVIQLDFLRPMQATNTTEFLFEPESGGTHVHWEMTGTNNFMGKAFSMVMNMDKLVGNDFEKGLAQLKAVVEMKSA
ncbi:MAG: SRPBCC family protein [Gemmataceae bacterium]